MENYKIKVNDEAESKEAQELFFELGYVWKTGLGVKHLDGKFLYARNGIITLGFDSDNFDNSTYKELTLPQLRDLVAKSKKEQGLISGADALRALADGEEVLWRAKTNAEVKSFRNQTPDLDLVLSGDCNYRFWIKPRTIKLELEIPAPFEPKDGEHCFVLDNKEKDGFYGFKYVSSSSHHQTIIQSGAWRTEEEIKQVVAALRGGIKA